MNKQFYKDALGWGFVLWLIGYILGIVLFAFVPPAAIGWVIMPIGTVVTLWVLVRKVNSESLQHYVLLATSWALLAILLDYFFLVKVFHPADGYYKLDVYLYYILTFILPLVVSWRNSIIQKRG